MLRKPVGRQSLRIRLFVRVVTPLVIVAVAIGIWRVKNTAETAREIFDRNLTAVSIAVAKDVASTGGELLSPETLDLLAGASGGRVFYHVYGPDGAYVSGYGYPPATGFSDASRSQVPVIFDSVHSDDPVRVSSLTQYVNADGIEGFARITVWQKQSVRRQFAINQTLLSLAIIFVLVAAVMAFVWFGVNSGLAPLIDLRNAIAIRSPQDLRPITRAVPEEVRSIVGTLNTLFHEVSNSIEVRDRFVANAAHQLRNPISAIQALAESALSARNADEKHRRVQKTVEEAKHTSQLAEQLLMLEKLSQSSELENHDRVDLNKVVLGVSSRNADRTLDRGIDFSFEPSSADIVVDGDTTLLSEAVENLVDNALKHGGNQISALVISLDVCESKALLVIEDDGKGIPDEDHDIVFERFTQLDHGHGSGLGLSIVKEIVHLHGGSVDISTGGSGQGTRFRIELPLAATSTPE